MKRPQSQNIRQQFEGQLRQIDIQLEDLNSRRADYEVYAPIDGVLLAKSLESGAYLQPGMLAMEIGNTEGLYIESDILVADIANIREGAEVIISHKDLGIIDLRGRVRKIHPQAFSSISNLGIEQKRIKVDIAIEGSMENLRPGYDLDMKIIVDQREGTLIIPESAVFQQDGRDFVFLNNNGVAAIREIQKGMESQRQVEVLSGLLEGDIVILSPSGDLEEGIGIVDKNN